MTILIISVIYALSIAITIGFLTRHIAIYDTEFIWYDYILIPLVLIGSPLIVSFIIGIILHDLSNT